jgi:hypothetical protein
MKYLAYPLFLLLLVPSLSAQKRTDAEPQPIIFPDPPKPPAPKPPDPVPDASAKLGIDQLYVIRSSVEAIVITSPAGVLKVTKESGPLKIWRTKFYGNGDKPETRTFSEKYLYLIETLSKGQAELIVIPPGGGEKDIIRRQIEALDGPQPPPVPPGPPITISIEPVKATIPIGGKQQFTAMASQGGVSWKSSVAGTVDQNGLFSAMAAVGSATITASSVLDLSKTAAAIVTVTDAPPAPIPVAGFRVLILYGAKDEESYPPAQQAILYDSSIRSYLNAKCIKGIAGTPERRIWDAGVDASAESKLWQDALKREHKTLPWIIISDGKTGYEGALPKTVDETLTLLRKYGGA